MVAMTAAVVLGVIALMVAILAWVTWRRGADERQSVQHHQHTLETLRHVADRRQQAVLGRRGSSATGAPTTRPASATSPAHRFGGEPQRSGNGAANGKRSASTFRRATAAQSSVGNAGPADAGPDLARRAAGPSRPAKESAKVVAGRRETTVFADEAPAGRGAVSPPISPSAARRMGGQLPGAAEQARRKGRTRVRRTRLAAAAAVLAIGGVVGGALASRRSPAPTRPATHPSHPITAAGHGSATTITVAPSPLAPTASTSFTATYAAPPSAYTVSIDVSAQCWVMATDPSTGHVVWTGTIPGGQSRALPVSGDLTIQLGAPSDASVTMNGQHVELPTSFRSPFSLIFRAA
jgi:hypothetical protein